MRWVVRSLVNGLVVVSLILCVGTAMAWVRSYWRWDAVRWWNGSTTLGVGVVSSAGGLEVWGKVWSTGHKVMETGFSRDSIAPPLYREGFLHIALVRSGARGESEWGAEFPHWVVVLVAGLGPLVKVRAAVRGWRRGRPGLCVRCGYDLTGNVSGVCPECGREIGGKTGLMKERVRSARETASGGVSGSG